MRRPYAGADFVTLCTRERVGVFGEVVDGAVRPNVAADIVRDCWIAIADHFTNARTDAFVIMPNHVHGIVCLADRVPLHEDAFAVRMGRGAK